MSLPGHERSWPAGDGGSQGTRSGDELPVVIAIRNRESVYLVPCDHQHRALKCRVLQNRQEDRDIHTFQPRELTALLTHLSAYSTRLRIFRARLVGGVRKGPRVDSGILLVVPLRLGSG
jgi:hypothetical protein